ncbi:MAG: TIGR03862 family flavoprotein [Bacteroidota bacterium]
MNKKISIIGGGACALMLACELDTNKFDVAIYEKYAAPGRKFLVAGEGGLNLTHAEDPGDFIERYTPSGFLKQHFDNFNNHDLVKWINDKGVETFEGSSGRIFPKKGIKPVEVLNVLLETIRQNRVALHTKCEWKGFTPDNSLVFELAGEEKVIKSDLVIFCLGGASWPVTGSTGSWTEYFSRNRILVKPFEASNCSFNIHWPSHIITKIEGKALKNCAVTCGGKTVHGEVVLTRDGMEGSGIYPLSPQIREQLKTSGAAEIFIDFKPAITREVVLQKLEPQPGVPYTKNISKRLNLNPLHITLLKQFVHKEEFLKPAELALHIKRFKMSITGCGPLADAISSVGGIALNEISEQFELKKMPGCFVLGEMLDYDAPTGGYLLQSCFTMAKGLADYLNTEKGD